MTAAASRQSVLDRALVDRSESSNDGIPAKLTSRGNISSHRNLSQLGGFVHRAFDGGSERTRIARGHENARVVVTHDIQYSSRGTGNDRLSVPHRLDQNHPESLGVTAFRNYRWKHESIAFTKATLNVIGADHSLECHSLRETKARRLPHQGFALWSVTNYADVQPFVRYENRSRTKKHVDSLSTYEPADEQQVE